MKYRITLNDEDYLRFKIFNLYHTKSGERQINKLRMRVPLISVVLVLLLIVTDARHDMIIPYAIFLAIYSGISFIRVPKRIEKIMQKQIDDMKDDGRPPYYDETEIEFLESMIVQRSEHSERCVKHSGIEKIYVENDYLYIYLNARQALVIPYRYLGEDKERVIEYVMSIKD